MKKPVLILMSMMISGILLTGCGASSSQSGSSTTDNSNETSGYSLEKMTIEGRCLMSPSEKKMLVFSGSGSEQQVYIITGDESENKLYKRLNDGDKISMEANVNTSVFPQNVTILNGTYEESGDSIQINEKLYNTLKGICILDDSVTENSAVEIIGE